MSGSRQSAVGGRSERPPPLAVLTYLATGRAVSIGGDFGAVDIRREVAEPLARLARFHGQAVDPDGTPLSVAEHCVRGADTLYAEIICNAANPPLVSASSARARRLAFAFLVHDAHEAITADPPRNFIAMLARKFAGVKSHETLIQDAVDEVKAEVDAALGFAPALALDAADRALVATMDRRSAAAEIAFCFRRQASHKSQAPLPPFDLGLDDLVQPDLTGRGIPGYPLHHRFWKWPRAAAEWMDRYQRWRPA